MNYQKKTPDSVLKILSNRKTNFIDIDYYAWPQLFNSTAGPSNGMGGCSMSTFTIEAYICDAIGPVVYICSNMYRFDYKYSGPFKHVDNWVKI